MSVNDYMERNYQSQLANATQGMTWTGNSTNLGQCIGATMSVSGSKPVVICNGHVVECDDMDKAQSKAEALAHQHSQDAYILKPVKRIAPKRDVVTTDLP